MRVFGRSPFLLTVDEKGAGIEVLNEVVHASGYGAECTLEAFLAGQFHDEVRSTLGEGVLAEAVALAREYWMARPELFISIDIEADGAIPGDYSMSSIGAVVVGEPSKSFYRELLPISERFDAAAVAVSGLDRAHLEQHGVDAAEAMLGFATWIAEVAEGHRPVFVAFNATFDWMFVHWYFIHFLGRDPFGISGLDVKAYYMAALRKRSWSETTKGRIEARFRSALPHTHNALDDAREQAEVFAKVKAFVEAGG
jgi:DNA polymerase III alpha subunit (gram-positive type)